MKDLSLYQTAHLVVAAIRVLEYRDGNPPTVEAIAGLLIVSAEQAHRLCRKLESNGIVKITGSAYDARVFIQDHGAIEGLSDEPPKSGLEEELEKFKKDQQSKHKAIDDLKNKEASRRQELFKQIEEQLKKQQARPPEG